MADYNNPPPSGSHHPPPPPGAGGEDNEPRIDGDGQEVNALRFLGAGAAGPPAPPAPSITPVSTGVSQPLPSQQPPAPPQTPHQHQPPSQALPQPGLIPNTPGGVSYDPYSDPSGAYHMHGGGMQIPPGPMSGPYGMAAGPTGAPPGMMGGGQMMMMPTYPYGMYPNPYGFMPAAGPYQQPAMAPQQPQSSQSTMVAALNVLRVNNPKYYREWYKKYTAHKRNPSRVPFPPIPQVPGFPQMDMGWGNQGSQTLPGRSRKDSSRSVNGDLAYSRGGYAADFPGDTSYSHVPSATSSLPRRHHPTRSGRTSVNGDYPKSSAGLPPDDDFDTESHDAGDLSSFNLTGHLGQNSHLSSTFNYSQGPGSVSDRDRPPTHSGRSSTVGEPYNRIPPGDIYPGGDQQDSLTRYDSGLYNNYQQQHVQQREPSPPRRMTPMKFNTLHCIATMSPLGHMIRVKSSGGGNVLEFIKMRQFVGHLPEYKEMESFPGPLTQLSTHKNTVIQFCKRKIKEARSNPAQTDRENYILLWEFLMLMLRQNGMVVGSDIAELLLTAVQQQQEKRQELLLKQAESLQKEEVRDSVEGSDGSGVTSGAEDKEQGEGESSGDDVENHRKRNVPPAHPPVVPDTPVPPVVPVAAAPDEKKLVEEFCSHLLYGHKKDALDFAMDHGLWGHALFFASKMDERSYGHVLARFANGIPLNSPLQTLYHIMCGKQPASVTSCGDGGVSGWEDEATATFGDWKPHLAMLLSNSGYKPEIEHRAILTLGDTLQAKAHWFAAQFCFLMGHEEFRKDSRLGPLLGYSPQRKNVLEATQMTEVYEFARKLADPGFSLGVSFLQSKLDYAKRLVSYGFVEEALAYCEEITKVLRQSGRKPEEAEELITLCGNTLRIAERIAVADESGTANGTWVEELRKMAQEPGLFEEDFARKLSLVSSNQEQHSEQGSYTSSSQQYQQQPPQMGDGNIYNPYEGGSGTESQAPSTTAPPSEVNMPSYLDSGMVNVPGSDGRPGQTEVMNQPVYPGDNGVLHQQQQQLQDNNNWGHLNGGLHLSQPPQLSPPQQQQQQQPPQNMYEPPPITNRTNSYGQQDGSYQQQQQQPQYGQTDMGMGGGGYPQQTPGMDAGYSSGGYNDKMSNAAPTINNNSWYNPYDSQPQSGLGGGAPSGIPDQYQNSSPVKKKSVRFEDEQKHNPHEGSAEGKLIMGGGKGSTSVNGGGVGVESIVRARFSRPTTLDLKSALKSPTSPLERPHHHVRERIGANGFVNGGSTSAGGSPTAGPDIERCSRVDDKGNYFEVEYKSTYPIDEPIQSPRLASLPKPLPPQGERGGLTTSASRLLPNKRASSSTSHKTSSVCPPIGHPFPVEQHQLLLNNHSTSGSTSSSRPQPQRRPPGKTYQVDKECCDVNQPCEDHGDFLDGDEEEIEDDFDLDEGEDDEDEEGGGGRVGKLNSNDIEGVENGGYHHRHQGGQYARFENKTENSKLPPAPASPSAGDKKNPESKKGSKDTKSLDGGGANKKEGWFSGISKMFKGKNQMHLPDDKNPTIVWDPQQKRWINKGGDGDDDTAPAGPPPKDTDLMGGGGPPKPPGMMMGMPPGGQPPQQQQPMMQPQQQQPQQGMMMNMGGGLPPQPQNPQYQMNNQMAQQPGMMTSGQGAMNNAGGPNLNMGGGMPPSQNKYKLQKGRGHKGYVDVLNPNGSVSTPQPPVAAAPAPSFPSGGGGGGIQNFFVPPPMPVQHGAGGESGPVSFLTPPSLTTNLEDNNVSEENR